MKAGAPPHPRRGSRAGCPRWAGLLAVTLLMASCGSDDLVAPPTPKPLPEPRTPELLIERFVQIYTTRSSAPYAKLFTADFRFEFSNAADPFLVQEYPGGWTKHDEVVSATNLFEGGVNDDSIYQPAALDIELAFASLVFRGDTAGGRDSSYHKVLLTPVNMEILVPGDLTYRVGETPMNQRFYVVRGDHAKSLDAGQPADSLHWYIWWWRDESPPLKPQARTENPESTWGGIKGLYR